MRVATGLLTPDSLPMPEDRENNFWYVRNTSETVVVFLHGIFSKSRTCWLFKEAASNTQVFWPDLVRNDSRLGAPAIYMAGYYTAVDAGDFSIKDCARDVFEALTRPELDGYPPALNASAIVFVCHSTGGIVARYLLERNKERFRNKQVGLALIASPSLGSVWANVGSLAAKYYNNRLGLQLRWGESLEDLHGRFRDLVNRGDIPNLFGMEACESQLILRASIPAPIRAFLPNRLKVVTTISAGQYFGEVKVLRGTDHFSTVKPNNLSHPTHEFLVTFMLAFRETFPLPPEAPTLARAVPDVPSAQGRAIPQAISTAPAGPSVIQVTQVFVTGTQPLLGAETTLALASTGVGLPVPVGNAGHAAAAREATPRPRLEELFEIVTDPNDVMQALFRTDRATGLAPYDVEYVNARDDVPDTQQAMERALRESRGRLVVRGLRGIGKTREVAELARSACQASWKILVARDDADARLGPPTDMPAGWADARVLLVVDNLHTRVRASSEYPTAPYMDRLEQLLQWLEERLPGSVRVVATVREEPHFQAQLDLPREGNGWHGFRLYRLPMLTSDGLVRILTALAAQTGVKISLDEAPKLIENSDRKPGTVFINVDIARLSGAALDRRTWRPTEGESWRLRFISARADHPGVDRVCRVLRVLTDAGLPARVGYVISIARDAGELNAEAAIRALVGEGLLSARQEVLTPFSADQLAELVDEHEVQAVRFPPYADSIERAITDATSRGPDWGDDLLTLSSALQATGDLEAAERVATRAIELKAGGPRAYRVRAGIRFRRPDLPGAEADLTAALEGGGGEDRDTRFFRGSVRILLAEFDGAIVDLDAALRLGRDDAVLHSQLGSAYYQLGRWSEANVELTAAIGRGDASAMVVFSRAIVRMQIPDLTGADEDLSVALERGIDLGELAGQIRELQDGMRVTPGGTATELKGGSLLVRGLRGLVRFKLGRHPEADEDLSEAIAGGFAAHLKAFAEALNRSTVPVLARAKDQFEAGVSAFGDAGLLHIRGLTRLNQNKDGEALADFEAAIGAGFVEAEAYFGRGWARLRTGDSAGAELDATAALERGKEDGYTYALRGFARFALQRFESAEQDLTKAVDLGGGDARALFVRGCVRFDEQRYEDAARDFTAALEQGFALPGLFSLRGLARLALGDVQGADDDAESAFARGVADVHTHSLRAAVRVEQQRHEEAEQAFNAAFALGRNDAWLHFHRGRVRQALDRHAEAEQDYDAIGADFLDAEVLVRRGQARLAQRKAAEAADDFTDAIVRGRDDAFVHYYLARARQDQKRYDDAEREFQATLARDNQPLFQAARGRLRLVRGHFRGSEEDCTDAIDRGMRDTSTLQLRGLARFGLGNAMGALADLDAALELAPEDADAISWHVLVCLRLGDVEKASRDCAQLDAIHPDGAETLGAWGALYLARGDHAAALDRFAAAAPRDGTWYFWQGLVHLMLGRLDEARGAVKLGLTDSVPGDAVFATNELDFRLSAPANQSMRRETRATAALIKGDLAQLIGAPE